MSNVGFVRMFMRMLRNLEHRTRSVRTRKLLKLIVKIQDFLEILYIEVFGKAIECYGKKSFEIIQCYWMRKKSFKIEIMA